MAGRIVAGAVALAAGAGLTTLIATGGPIETSPERPAHAFPPCPGATAEPPAQQKVTVGYSATDTVEDARAKGWTVINLEAGRRRADLTFECHPQGPSKTTGSASSFEDAYTPRGAQGRDTIAQARAQGCEVTKVFVRKRGTEYEFGCG